MRRPPQWWEEMLHAGTRRGDSGDEDRMIELSGEIKQQTERAIQWGDGSRTIWLPRSQIEVIDANAIQCRYWVAKKAGLI